MVALNDPVTDCVRDQHCMLNNCSYPPSNTLGQDFTPFVIYYQCNKRKGKDRSQKRCRIPSVTMAVSSLLAQDRKREMNVVYIAVSQSCKKATESQLSFIYLV